MNELIKKYPKFEKQIREIFSFQNSIKAFRKIDNPNKATGDSKIDVPFQFSHFLNTIHLRFQSQIDYLILGLKDQNPEAFSTVRNCLESIAALIFVYDKIKTQIEAGNYDEARMILYKASMGQRTEHPLYANSKEVKDIKERAFNVLSYIDRANELTSKDLRGVNKDWESKQNYFRSQYDLLCELTHPNYLALSMFWGVGEDNFSYNFPPKTLIEEYFGLLVHTISPLLPIYVLYLKRAQQLESRLNRKNEKINR